MVLASVSAEAQLAYTIVGLFVVAVAAVGIFWKGVRSVFRTIRRFNEAVDSLQEIIKEWKGEPPTNGDPGRPSYPVRMANVERTLASLMLPAPPRRAQPPRRPAS